ncbi:MAG TPA: HEPN domain-containing protein [Rhodocyclaceae bacterium]|nr:HEPN domain-containing protein [Rhodocyclaceae bacterium]
MKAQDLMAKAVQAAASAKVLLDIGDADGASNRAYYAMFDAARAALLASGFDVGKTHKGVLNAFSDRLVKNGPLPKEMGRLLKHAETFRYVADYAGDPVEPSDARVMVNQAEIFVAAIRTEFMPEDSNDDNYEMEP